MAKLKQTKITVHECEVSHGCISLMGVVYSAKPLVDYHGQTVSVKLFKNRSKVAVFDGDDLICVAKQLWHGFNSSGGVAELIEKWCTPAPTNTASEGA